MVFLVEFSESGCSLMELVSFWGEEVFCGLVYVLGLCCNGPSLNFVYCGLRK